MFITTTNEWELSNKSGLVSVGSYSLFVSTRGPPRKSSAPVVIFITGGGVPTEFYVHMHYAISKFARNYFYDRAGYGRSERPELKIRNTIETAGSIEEHAEHPWWAPGGFTIQENEASINDDSSRPSTNGYNAKRGPSIWAQDSASELHQLMHAINVQPPYVLAAHSYGGIIARTYYGLYSNEVAGIALLDTNSELLQQCLAPIPPPAYLRVTANVDQEKMTNLRERSGMTDEEWKAAVAAIRRTRPASADEVTHGSGRQLARRMQIDKQAMGDKPLVVMVSAMVEWLRLFLEEGVKLGGGTEDERREAEWWVESAELFWLQVQRLQLGLSSNAEFVRFADVGHDFPICMPERTAGIIEELLHRVVREREVYKVST